MRSRMHPRYYLSQEIFELEQEKIFRKTWLFAGLLAMIPESGSSVVRNVSGILLVLGNVDGKPRAHAVAGTHEYALQVIGGLLFVNLDSQPMPIEAQFAPEFIQTLESSSNAYDLEFIITTWHCKFNWKLVYENLWDPLHVRFLHPRTLAPRVDLGVEMPQGLADEAESPLADRSIQAMHEEMRRFSRGGPVFPLHERPRPPWQDKVDRWGDGATYYDWLTYPNLHISSGNGGFTFSFEHHTPVAPDRTDLELIWIMSRKNEPIDFSYQALLANLHGSKLIVGEDVAMLEAIQAGLHRDAPMPNQGLYESRTRRRERWYAALMDDSACAI